MIKITFVVPDFENLGVEYLMALCQKNGFATDFVFYQAENSYLGFKKRYINYPDIVDKILASQPDLVGFSCVTDKYQYQLRCAKLLKKKNSKIKTIFGGVHATALPRQVLRQSAIDAVAIGEADISFLKFINLCSKKGGKFKFPEKSVKGIIFKQRRKFIGKFQEGELINLNTLPLPNKNIAAFPQKHLYFIMTSRGCPYNCSYCFHSITCKLRGKRDIRQRTVGNVIRELLWAKRKYRLESVFFGDDSFTTNKTWLNKFLDLYQKKINLPFACEANPNYIDDKIAHRLSLAGCVFVGMGIQSLSANIGKHVLNRIVPKYRIIQAIQSLKKEKIMIQADHMFGIPYDTIINQEKAVLFYNQYRPDIISVFWLTYYPKIPIIQTALKLKLINKKDLAKIEQGEGITNNSLHTGGSLKNPQPLYSLQFILNYLPFMPKAIVRFLIKRRLYRIFNIKSYFIATAIPRLIHSLKNKNYLFGRALLRSYLKNLFPQED